jgi:hypothetical protein
MVERHSSKGGRSYATNDIQPRSEIRKPGKVDRDGGVMRPLSRHMIFHVSKSNRKPVDPCAALDLRQQAQLLLLLRRPRRGSGLGGHVDQIVGTKRGLYLSLAIQ